MPDLPNATPLFLYLAGLPAPTQIILAVTISMMTIMLIVWREYRRRTRTTPTLRARVANLAAHGLNTAWAALRTPPNTDQKTKRANTAENALVFFFVFVVAGLIMQGLIPFARDDMGLTGPWPYLFFFALDGMAAYFGLVAYRLAKAGAKATNPRVVVLVIVCGSAWFQWAHAADRDLPARVAWTVLPLIAGYLWETVLKYRRRAWKKANTDTGRQVPTARWMWDPIGSLGITRRTHMWNLGTWEEGLETHMPRAECVRQLRREFGVFWAYRVPADVAIRLKRGFKVDEAAARIPKVIATHRREVENRRLVKEAQRAARAVTAPTPGVYTVTLPETPVVDLAPVPGVTDVVEPLEPAPVVEQPALWEDPTDPARVTLPLVEAPAPADDEKFPEFDPFPDEAFPAPFVPTPRDTWVDPWDQAPATLQGFIPLDVPTAPATADVSTVAPEPEPEFWDTIETAGETVTPAQKTSPAPSDVANYQPAPYTGTRWDEAITLYKQSVDKQAPLSTRALCKALNVSPNNRRWANKVITAANEALF